MRYVWCYHDVPFNINILLWRDRPKLVFFDLTECLPAVTQVATNLFGASCPTKQVIMMNNLKSNLYEPSTPCLELLPFFNPSKWYLWDKVKGYTIFFLISTSHTTSLNCCINTVVKTLRVLGEKDTWVI